MTQTTTQTTTQTITTVNVCDAYIWDRIVEVFETSAWNPAIAEVTTKSLHGYTAMTADHWALIREALSTMIGYDSPDHIYFKSVKVSHPADESALVHALGRFAPKM